MPRQDLKNKPLVEAILELRWELESRGAGIAGDPHYRILLGRFFERIHQAYPAHEPLPTAAVPDDMVAHVVQHRFRASAGAWPLVQLGPGVMTVNETSGYKWADFEARCVDAVQKLVDAHPEPNGFRVNSLMLRYLDAIPLDVQKQNVFEFLREKMKTTVALPDNLFADTPVSRNPSAFTWQASFRQTKPAGIITVRFATGHREGEPILVWETLVVSEPPDIPSLPADFPAWLEAAHNLTDDWFFKLIEGELERRFSGE